MKKKLTLGSLFDGSGGFPLAGIINGITPIWSSEIEPFPIRVTTKRLPLVKHYGDINQMNGAEIEPVDIITFGSPCTNLSVAGRREGLEGEQSSLFFEAIRIIREMRESTNGKYPRYILWENVPGAFSSTAGRDFRCVLEEIVKIKDETADIPMPDKNKWMCAGEIVGDDYSVAWRTLDAQHWGVPQRRRRIFLVADFASRCAGKILFEFEGVYGHTAAGGVEGEGTAADTESGTGATGGDSYGVTTKGDGDAFLSRDRHYTLSTGGGQAGQGYPCVAHPAIGVDGYNQNLIGDAAQTIRAGRNDGDHTGMLLSPVIGFEPGAMSRLGGHAWFDFIGALRAHAGDNQTCVAIPIDMRNAVRNSASGDNCGLGIGEDGEPAFTVTSDYSHAVAIENHPADSRMNIDESGTVQTLTSRMGTGGGNVPMVMNERQHALTVGEDVANTLTSTDYKGTQCVFENSVISECFGFCPDNSITAAGVGFEEDKTATLSTTKRMGVVTDVVPKVYGICSQTSNSMKSSNPHSGIYEAETSRTLDGNGGNPACHQGGVAVVCVQGSMIGRKDENGPQGNGVNEDVSFTLNATDRHAVAYDCRNHKMNEVSATLQAKNNGGQSLNYINPVVYALDRTAYNQGQNAQFDISISDDDTAQTVLAKGPGAVASFYPQMKAESQCFREDDTSNTLVNGTNPGYQNGILEPPYTVRRLTPLECCRLQGFPDWWCAELHTDEPADTDIEWWAGIFETHRKIMGTSKKPKTRNQIIKWLENPYSDSAEYKMWGNGVALPCVAFVLGGITWADGMTE